MTLYELKSECERIKMEGGVSIPLVLNYESRGLYPKLCKTFGPTGVLICQHPGKTLVSFKVDKILSWLKDNV
jgi:hypothetical protein